MTRDDICFLPAHRLQGMIRDRSISPRELVDAVLARIEDTDPSVNAFAALNAEDAREQARRAERTVNDGQSIGPLHGIPITIKDLTDAAGLPTQRGSRVCAGPAPAIADSPFVARLKAAGAIVIGKTTTSEFGWSALSRSPLTGVTHNPWKHGYQAGASSSGAGAAAAAGYGPLHQGTDAAGSIRLPAHFCGVFGMKPTFGRVPMVPVGNLDYTSHAGSITRDVRDAAMMLRIMAGPHSEDHTSLNADPVDYADALNRGLRGKRIALSTDLGHARVEPEIVAAIRKAAAVFADLGCVVEEVTPDWGLLGPDLVRFFWPANMTMFARHLPRWEAQMDVGLVACIRAGLASTARDYQEHRERKLAYCSRIGRWFEEWDLLLTPSASVAAFPADLVQPRDWPQHPWDWLAWAEFSYPFNFAGMPAASVPCGFVTDGLPIGVQIVGRRFDDLSVLQAAAAFEQAQPWASRRPPLNKSPSS